ncbi:hypothetical protein THRCLA_02756 [Thraustotheca clavata]|uniref:XPA C-terminal domain-containing protein n=1 Tax=Thraustotheca clavata TaxID=74557 RepID=A0A1W0A4E5_9STRA|nr:hypothetical protein THRCLA_02756 [Thraustotheca clavata]
MTFSVHVCRSCRYENAAYALLTKTNVKKRFLLADSTLNSMPCLRKPNPKHERFAPLKLYLTKACETKCIDIYGSMEKMIEEKEKREKNQYEKAVSRTKSVIKGYGKRKATSTNSATRSKKTKDVEEHQHEYIQEVEQDNGLWLKTCACGLSVTFHKL